jgi:phage terminase large subunit-like protein
MKKVGGVESSKRVPRDQSGQNPAIFPRNGQSLADFEQFCRTLVLDTGNPLILEDFQKTLMTPYFNGRPETVAVLPTGNAKSTLLGALAPYHMLHVEDAECLIAASAADQAELIFKQAAGLIERSPIRDLFDIKRGIRTIYHKGDGPNRRPPGRIRVLSADVNRNDGAIPTLVLVDELHRHKDGGMYNMFQARLNKRGAQMLTISNAGYNVTSPLALLREKAHADPAFTRKDMFNHCRMGSLEFFEWCLADTDDPDDLELVKRANPLAHITPEHLRTRRESPLLHWPEWLRATCGLWTTAEFPWIEGKEWDGYRVDIGGVEDGEQVWLHAWAGSGGGVAIAAPREEGVAVRTETVGDAPLEVLERLLVGLADQYDVREVGYDKVQFRRSAELLEARGLPMVEIPHSTERTSIASVTLSRLVKSGQLRHDGDDTLRSHVLAGLTKESERGWRFVPTPQSWLLSALALAVHQATQVMAEPPEFIAL